MKGASGPKRVLKIFQDKGDETANPAIRRELANIVENTARYLRKDAAFRRRFGDIIPRAEVIGEGATLQDHIGNGVELTSLPPALASVARDEANAAIRMARAHLRGVPVSGNLENFLFDRASGRIVGWFDHLSHANLPEHIERGRASRFNLPPSRLTIVTARSQVAMTPQLPDPRRGVSDTRAAAWRRSVEHMLASGTKVDDQANGVASTNATRVVTLRMPNGRKIRAIWKPVSGETATIENYPQGHPFAGDTPYPLRSLFMNEIRSAALAGAIGLHFLVPPTVERTMDGQRGSLQLFAEGATSASNRRPNETLDRAAAEKLRVFDYITGNADRVAGNMLVRKVKGKNVPVGIDGALSFPRGTTLGLDVRPFPTQWIEGQTGALLASTNDFIRVVDPHTIARTLVESGADDRQIAHTLRRLERLKRNPSILEVRGAGVAGMKETLDRVRTAAESREH